MIIRYLIVWITCGLICVNCYAEVKTREYEKEKVETKALLPIKGFSINSPSVSEMNAFCQFVEEELAPIGVNLLLLRVNYQFDFKSVDKMGATGRLPLSSIRMLEAVCKKNQIKLVPHLELFGHQSSGSPAFIPNTLLKNYPEFDEVAGKPDSVNYGYRSYCPLHPDLHPLLFKMIEEMAGAFTSKDFHIGCDEVMTLGVCDRCKMFLQNGGTKADLLADEMNRLSNFLLSKGYRPWIWGDRLINANDASKFGVNSLSEWEASNNDTHSAIDKISKKIVVCDWHYKGAPTTHLYFAEKGFDVIPCFYNVEEAAMKMLDNIVDTRTQNGNKRSKDHCLGIMGTNWGSSVTAFMDEYRKVKSGIHTTEKSGAYVFYKVFSKIKELESDFDKKER